MRLTWLAVLCMLAGSVMGQRPIIYLYDTQNLGGDRFGLTIAFEFTEIGTASAFFKLDVAGANGTQIIQQLAQNGTSVNLFNEAVAQDGIGGYDRDFDSWWYAGPTTNLPTPTPPYSGVDLSSGLPGSNEFRASYAFHLAGGPGNYILYLAVQGNDGKASIHLDGLIGRRGVDYYYDQTITVPEPGSMVLSALGGLGLVVLIVRQRQRKRAA